jgi:hypothetical protein
MFLYITREVFTLERYFKEIIFLPTHRYKDFYGLGIVMKRENHLKKKSDDLYACVMICPYEYMDTLG